MKWKFYLLTWVYCIALNVAFVAIVLFAQVMLQAHIFPLKEELQEAGEHVWIIFLFSGPFSIPGILVLLFATHVSDFFLNRQQRFVFIIISCMTGTVLCYLLLWCIMGINPFSKNELVVLLSLAAVCTALLIQRKRFYKTFMPV